MFWITLLGLLLVFSAVIIGVLSGQLKKEREAVKKDRELNDKVPPPENKEPEQNDVEVQFHEHRESYESHYAVHPENKELEQLTPTVLSSRDMHRYVLSETGQATPNKALGYASTLDDVQKVDIHADKSRGMIQFKDGTQLVGPHHGHGNLFGSSMDKNPTGTMLAVSARAQSMKHASGMVYIYSINADKTERTLRWTLESPNEETGGMFGWTVRFVTDELIFVSAPLERQGKGRAYIYRVADDVSTRPIVLGQINCLDSAFHFGLDARFTSNGSTFSVMCKDSNGRPKTVDYRVQEHADDTVQWDRFDGELSKILVPVL